MPPNPRNGYFLKSFIIHSAFRVQHPKLEKPIPRLKDRLFLNHSHLLSKRGRYDRFQSYPGGHPPYLENSDLGTWLGD
jgi:hypothetical protein